MDAFSVRTKIMIGGGMDALAQRLHRVFLVTDKFMAESGKTNYVTDRLLRNGGEFKIFSDVQADPDIATVTRGVEQILEFQPDAVVAFGGGSAIDAAKAIVFFAARERDITEPDRRRAAYRPPFFSLPPAAPRPACPIPAGYGAALSPRPAPGCAASHPYCSCQDFFPAKGQLPRIPGAWTYWSLILRNSAPVHCSC